MAQLDLLLDRVHDEFPMVPEALALRALSDACREFLSRTHSWQEALPRINLRAGTSVYELYPDDGVQIAAIKDVRLDGRKIEPVATELVRLRTYTPSPGEPAAYIQRLPIGIELVAPPIEAARLTVEAALTLALNATTVDIPDVILDESGEAIAAGAKMRLVRQAGQPWFAPDASPLYAMPFYQGVTHAKGRMFSALGEAEMMIQPRRWV